MVFKLVRTDTADPRKIQLSIGKHLFGRGKLLDCEDKRVSRNHGELEVDDDKLVIKALHQNPCFILKKGITETQILSQNSVSEISNGDKFGLLPDTYWYEVLHCTDIDSGTDPQEDDVVTSTVEVKQEENEDANSAETQLISENMEVVESNLNDTVGNDIPGSPSLIGAESNQETLDIASSHANDSADQNNQDAEDTSPAKRCHSPGDDSSDSAKKIKTESEVKQEPDDAQAGPSNNQVDSNSDSTKDQKPVIQPPPNPALRERCMYGASCYRRNPQHKAQFSHPTDPDWGSGAQAPCPFGASCCKPDPRHWRDHSHPPGVTPPAPRAQQAQHPPNQQGNKRRKPKPKKRYASDDDDDDDSPAPGLIVQGKRVRKVITKTSTWSGSESEKEDPYGTDESDEWQPSSDVTDSQLYSQDM